MISWTTISDHFGKLPEIWKMLGNGAAATSTAAAAVVVIEVMVETEADSMIYNDHFY